MSHVTNPGVLADSPIKPVAPRPAMAQQQKGLPMRPQRKKGASSKVAVMSPEARKAVEDANRKMIADFIAAGRMEKCPVRWASGLVNTGIVGGSEA